MTKMHNEYPKISQNSIKWPKHPQNDQNTHKNFHITNIPLNPPNKQNAVETSENDLNIPKLSQNALNILDFEGILVGFKSLLSF